jgi:NAD dependent epimerase/dehydratase family enzyme
MIPIKIGFGSAIGTGKQYMPWIHIDDLCDIYIKAIEDTQMNGAYNAVAPEHLTNKEFTKTLASIHKRKLWFSIPAVVMKTLHGEMSAILLQGSRISSEKIQTAGFKFQFPSLEGALKQLMH